MKTITTVIVGAGHSGLAMSHHLARRSIDHVLLERGEVANSWRNERWDSLRLLTPNWQSRLPGYRYEGDSPDGYMDMAEVVSFIGQYAKRTAAPVQTNTNVESVKPVDDGYIVSTDRGSWPCRTLVVASGACNIATVPKVAQDVPAGITSLTPMQYRNPRQLDDGAVLIVGAAATGVQIAKEVRDSGRRVILAVGEHVRAPRTYRGRDIKWWLDVAGVLDMSYKMVDDIRRARRVPSLQLAGSPQRATLDLNALTSAGIEITGRVAGLRDGKMLFSGSLDNVCALADLKLNRLLDTFDDWALQNDVADDVDAPHRFEPTRVPASPRLELDLQNSGIKTIVWATGYRPNHSWLQVPVFDRKGRIVHDGGVVADAPGLYVMGLPFLRRRKSTLMDGADSDAGDLADHLRAYLNGRAIAA